MNNSILLEVNGILYEGFTELSYFKDIESISGSFDFSMSSDEKNYSPFKGQEVCSIIINNKPIVTGYIETIAYSYDSASHIIRISGRDKTCDVIDNSVVGDTEFKAPITLQNLIKNVLAQVGLDIDVINQVEDLEELSKDDLKGKDLDISAILSSLGLDENETPAANVYENMFDYIEKYARKKGVLLSSNGDGNIVISRASEQELDGILINKLNNNSNNIKQASISYDFSKRYFGYICKSQGNASALSIIDDDNDFGLANISGTIGSAIDTEIRRTRVLQFKNETSSESSSNQDRAEWEANIRRSRSVIYNCRLRELYVDKEKTIIFEPNKLIKVQDDFCDINALMLIKSVSYNLSLQNGTNVTLELVPKDSYTFKSSKDENDSKYDKIGDSVDAGLGNIRPSTTALIIP